MNKYPIGIQDFDKIREKGYLYIDKTQLIHKLIDSGSYYFLSRPRRFGKSLLLSTISAIFSGKKELFEGLWIHDQWDWKQKHPVIRISFSDIGINTLGLTAAIYNALHINASRLGISLTAVTYDQQFRELIEKAAVNGAVVILIDEYDKPITDNLGNLEKVEENRSVFKSLYSVLKDADPYIRLLLMTGVSRFSKVSVFSDLNNLNDITTHRGYATLTGITQKELESNFSAEIAEMQQQQQPDFLAQLKLWYNGYAWHPDVERVYNPFSVLKYMDERDFKNYWFHTGTPTWLVKLMRNNLEFKLENVRIGENALSNFNIEHIATVPALFQTGYLTIKAYDSNSGLYELGYPNKEVEDSLTDSLLSAYRNVSPGNDSMAVTDNLSEALRNNAIPEMIEGFNALISTIPYDHWKAESESIFHIILHLSFKRLGLDIQSEVHSAKGRCDILVFTDKYIYALELKLNGTAEAALAQIIEKRYLAPYQSDPRNKIAIGVNFSSETRAVEGFLVH
jgi:hypothetical protein